MTASSKRILLKSSRLPPFVRSKRRILTALTIFFLIGSLLFFALTLKWVFAHDVPPVGQVVYSGASDELPSDRGSSEYSVSVIAQGLEVPWALDFAPDGRIFFTERPGRIRVIENGILRPVPWATVSPLYSLGRDSGLLGLVLDPDFTNNHYLYVYYTYENAAGEGFNKVERYTDVGGIGSASTVILGGIPGGFDHAGGRIKFGPDGKLYITTGDIVQGTLAQDMNSLAGKIIRINKDGSIPADNPFPGSPIYSLGHRNPQGLAWDAQGRMFASEHGSVGMDEVNIIVAGENYGWPIARGKAGHPHFKDAFIDWYLRTPVSGIAVQGDDLYIATLGLRAGPTTRALWVVNLVEQGYYLGILFQNQFGRIRDVEVGPDGALYLLSSNLDGMSNSFENQLLLNDDHIYRVVKPTILSDDGQMNLWSILNPPVQVAVSDTITTFMSGQDSLKVDILAQNRDYYTLLSLHFPVPQNWAYVPSLDFWMKGIGLGAPVVVRVEDSSYQGAPYNIADTSTEWQHISIPLGQGQRPWVDWERINQIRIIKDDKTTMGTLYFDRFEVK